jgi:hypothetical protein
VLQAVGGGTHRVLFNAAPGVSGYYRMLLWWPQVTGAADVVVHGLNGRAATRIDPGLRSGQWVAAGVFALPADHAQIEVSAPAGMRLVVDALRLQYVGDTLPPPSFGVTAIPVAIAGVPYAAMLEIVDGTPPYVFSVDAIRLPPGIHFDAATGRFSGAPTAQGHYRFDVEVLDRVGLQTVREFELHVVAASRAAGAPDQSLVKAKVRDGAAPKDGVAAGTPPNLNGLVALIAALPEGEWTQASLNTYASVWTPAELRPLDGQSNPAPDRIILAWSGFTWDPNRGDLLLYGGGHANYSGNDVYRWRGSTRQWERASLPSEIAQDDLGNFQAIDGWDNAPGLGPHLRHQFVLSAPRPDGGVRRCGVQQRRRVHARSDADDGAHHRPFFFDPARADPNKVGGSTGSHVQRVAPHPEIVGGQMWANRDLSANLPVPPPAVAYVNGCAAYADENGQDVAYLGAVSGGSTNLNLYKYTASVLGSPAQDRFELAGVFWNGTGGATSCGVDPLRKLFVRTGNADVPFVFWDLNTAGADNRTCG